MLSAPKSMFTICSYLQKGNLSFHISPLCTELVHLLPKTGGVYRLMFASQLLREADDEALDRTSSAAFDFLLEGVAKTTRPSACAPSPCGSGRRCTVWPCWRPRASLADQPARTSAPRMWCAR